MAISEENTTAYRRGYYEGFLAGMDMAFGAKDYETLPEPTRAFVERLYLMAIANRDDSSMIKLPPTSAMPSQAPLATERKHLPESIDSPSHWSDKFD